MLLIAGLMLAPFETVSTAAAEPRRPNVLLIVLDDGASHGMETMLSRARARIAGKGVTYKRSWVAIPSCCPERGTLLTGQYPHNHGVRQQQLGGVLDQKTTLPADLRRAGYRTYYVGKMLHQLEPANPTPGVFDRWLISPVGPLGGGTADDQDTYVDPYFNLDGVFKQFLGYTTAITGRWGRAFLADAERVNDGRPWYLSLNFKAPHLPAIPEPKYATRATPDYTIPVELDRSDKPPYVRNVDVSPAEANPMQADMYRTMLSVDDQIALTLDWLDAHGEADNTLVLLTSDNGYLLGEHKLTSKFTPYTPSINVPLWVRGPGFPAGVVNRTRWVSAVDVAATVYEATGTVPSRTLDGESLRQPGTRNDVFIEYFHDDLSWRAVPTWASLRAASYQYVEYYNDLGGVVFREWYDLANDPGQMRNLLGDANAANDPDTRVAAKRLSAYRVCRGAACR